MNKILSMQINYQNPSVFVVIAIFLMIIWGLIGYYILGLLYFVMSFLFFPGIFFLGIYFKVNNGLFMPVTYALVYGSDWISRYIMPIANVADFPKPLFVFLVLYHIELIILSVTTISLDAKGLEWSLKKKKKNKRIALILPVCTLCIYYFIIRQVFAFE